MLTSGFGAKHVALTDSGTSALVLALRLSIPRTGTVALPAYACVDLLAAAKYALARVRFYDIDPATLSPDLESVERALARGADAIVVAHLYGFPADVPGVAALAAAHGARVIEDAAQHAGGTLAGTRLGAFGPLTVLSFGRGKGTTGGGGGALLAHRDTLDDPPTSNAGWREWLSTVALWTLARPWAYGIPASIPALHLGETIYHDAHEPGALSFAAASVLTQSLARANDERVARQRTARALIDAIHGASALAIVRPIDRGESGYLRLPVLDGASRRAAPWLGVVRSYPRPLDVEPKARDLVVSAESPMLGARTICEQLFTLPTHGYVRAPDVGKIARWAQKAAR